MRTEREREREATHKWMYSLRLESLGLGASGSTFTCSLEAIIPQNIKNLLPIENLWEYGKNNMNVETLRRRRRI